MGISGRADLPWTASAVDDVRLRAAEIGGCERVDGVGRRRQDSLDVEAWEARRRSRTVRLWSAELVVRTPAQDVDDAAFRLVTLAHPYHRTGHARRLYSVAGPLLCQASPQETFAPEPDGHGPGPVPGFRPVGGSPPGAGSTPDAVERAQAAEHAAALELAGRGRHRTSPPTRAPALPCWQVWQRVSFLAGPGDAPARAAELAATVVDVDGKPAAALTRLDPEDGRRDPVDGRLVHPACDAGPHRIDALWDDFDAVDAGLGDPGEAIALAAVCLAAAREVRAEFGLESGDPVPAGRRRHCSATGTPREEEGSSAVR